MTDPKAPLPDEVELLFDKLALWRERKSPLPVSIEAGYAERRQTLADLRAHIGAQAEKIAELEERLNSPYCMLCGSCGEEGCCPDEMCKTGIAALEAANKRLREALEWIKANWDNQDMQHTEYRVKAFIEAKTALNNLEAVCHVCSGGGHSLISDCGCKSCNGTGKAALAQTAEPAKVCGTCGGSGIAWWSPNRDQPCWRCNGTGRV